MQQSLILHTLPRRAHFSLLCDTCMTSLSDCAVSRNDSCQADQPVSLPAVPADITRPLVIQISQERPAHDSCSPAQRTVRQQRTLGPTSRSFVTCQTDQRQAELQYAAQWLKATTLCLACGPSKSLKVCTHTTQAGCALATGKQGV